MGLFSDLTSNVSITTPQGTLGLINGKPSFALPGAQPQIATPTIAPTAPAAVPWYKKPLGIVALVAAAGVLLLVTLRR